MELSERSIQSLEREGWRHIYEWSDTPGTEYPEDTHQDQVVIIVTEGSVAMCLRDQVTQLQAGDRLLIPPGVPHSAVVGPQGCQFVVGEMVQGDS